MPDHDPEAFLQRALHLGLISARDAEEARQLAAGQATPLLDLLSQLYLTEAGWAQVSAAIATPSPLAAQAPPLALWPGASPGLGAPPSGNATPPADFGGLAGGAGLGQHGSGSSLPLPLGVSDSGHSAADDEAPTQMFAAGQVAELKSRQSLGSSVPSWDASVSSQTRSVEGSRPGGPAASEAAQTHVLSAGARGAPRPGEWIGDYQVVRELARGGMGVVYVARSTKLGREVALKLLLAGQETSLGFERFGIEARTAARLRHPNIVGIHEVGEEGGRPYLVMDLVAGTSLDEIVRAQGPLPQEQAARITRDLAGALAYAHQRAVLHRDLKPHNVILSSSGEPILTDFGLAKDVEAEGLTVSGQAVGTPAYMPPEQAMGELEAVDRRADVYGLGATLYHLLTGVAPFQGETLQLITATLLRDPDPPSRLRPGLARDLETICLKCLEKDPGARYRTMSELESDLDAYLSDLPIAARPPTLWERGRKWSRRNRTLARLGSLSLALSLTIGVGAWIQVQGAGRAATQREQERASAAAAFAFSSERAALDALPQAEGASEDALAARGAAALRTYVAAQRWRSLAPSSGDSEAALFAAACDLGEVTARSRQWLLAIQAYEEAAALSLDPERARGMAEAARSARDAEREAKEGAARARREAVLGAFTRAERGELDEEDFAFQQASYQVVRNFDPETRGWVCERLEALSAEERAASEAILGEALGVEGKQMVALCERRLAGGWTPSDEEDWAKGVRALEAWHARRTGATARAWTILGARQAERLGPAKLAQVRLAVAALAQASAPEAERALGLYLRSEQDGGRAARAGVALCLSGSERAGAVVLDALNFFGPTSPFAFEVRPLLHRLPGLADALGEDPARVRDRVGLLREEGKHEECLRILDEALARGEEAGLLFERSVSARLLGRLDESLRAAERAIELAPNRSAPRLARGFCLMSMRRFPAALAEAERIVGRFPDHSQAHLLRAKLRRLLGDPLGALSSTNDAIAADPQSVEGYTDRASLYLSRSKSAGAVERAADEAAAEQDLDSAQRLAPQSAFAVALRADLASQRGNRAQAIALLDRALETHPRQGYLWLRRAAARRAAGDLVGAERDAAQALELGEEPARALLTALRGEGRGQEARPIYEEGLQLAERGRLSEAGEVAARLESGPDDERRGLGLSLRCMILVRSERFAECLETAAQAAKLLPDDPQPWHMAGLAHYFRGDLEASIKAYSAAIERAPRAYRLLSNRASSYVAGWQRGRAEWRELAQRDLEASLEINDAQADAWGNLGAVRIDMGDRAGAITALRKSIAIDPNHPMATRARAMVKRLEAGR